QSKAYRRSPKQEKDLSKRLTATVMSGSGAGRAKGHAMARGKPHKGDLQIKGIARIEAKTTQAKSFSITREMIDKITDAAVYSDELPAIVVEFLNSLGKPEAEVAVIPMWALKALLDNARTNAAG